MNDVKFYDFVMQLNTYLRRTNILANKFGLQEMAIGKAIFNVKNKVPQEVFDELFNPLVELFNDRVKIMQEIGEANKDFEELLKQYYEYFKGNIQ